MSRETLVEPDEASLLYLNEFRSYVLAYTDGPRRMGAYLREDAPCAIDSAEPSERCRRGMWQRFTSLAQALSIPLRATD